jgi:hypothetical protein
MLNPHPLSCMCGWDPHCFVACMLNARQALLRLLAAVTSSPGSASAGCTLHAAGQSCAYTARAHQLLLHELLGQVHEAPPRSRVLSPRQLRPDHPAASTSDIWDMHACSLQQELAK